MAFPLIGFLGPIFELGKSFVGSIIKRKEMKQEHKVKMAEMNLQLKEKAKQKQIDSDTEIDKINTESMRNSWKDEFVLLLLSTPVIMGFLGYKVQVLEGFQALKEMPMWYQAIYVVMCFTIYGQRKLGRLFTEKFLGK